MSDLKPHLSLQLKHRLGALVLDAAFELTQPCTVLFGPSGSGKSTILRAIAGHLRPARAKIVLDLPNLGRQVAIDTANRIFIPPWKRFVRWSAQRPVLFPNMTVLENLQFVTPNASSDGIGTVESASKLFHLSHIANRKPAMLSGGEQQRAAIARAANSCDGRLLLLDEPFSGLDAPLRDQLLADLLLWANQTKTPVLSVTHDISEAFQLNAEVIKLHNGRITDQGPASVVLAEERRRLLYQLNGKP